MTISIHTLPPTKLSSAKESLDKDGFAVIPDILDPETTTHIYNRLLNAAEETRKRGNDLFMPALDPNASNIRVFYLMELDPIFRELIAHPAALDLAALVLGTPLLVSNFTANIAKPGSGSMKIHSDQSLVVPEPWEEAWGVNIIWCLTDVYFENGATLYIPGSHQWQRSGDLPTDAAMREQMQPFTARKGSIVVMDARVWHTSGRNVTEDKDRALLFAFYTRPFLRQQVNWAAAFSEETKRGLSDEMRELLGVNVRANVGDESKAGGENY
ncbi:hypothetical protein BDV18DRAFT_155961 [Aspergillus unguis]